jgi:hypothetical protein
MNISAHRGGAFEAIASGAVIAMAAVLTGLLYQLITLAAPLIEAMARLQAIR